MADLTLTRSQDSRLLEKLRKFLVGGKSRVPWSEKEQDDHRARQEFLLEALDKYPDVFSSEYDIQCLAHLHREKF